MYLCGDTAHEPWLKEEPGQAERDQGREEGGTAWEPKGEGEGIQYDQLVKYGCIKCREIKVSQKK